MLFQDRRDAGRYLAEKLAGLREMSPVVLALPRGGVPVGYEVARELDAPLDVFLVRKLGVPGHDELAFGAIASGGVRVLNREVIREVGIDRETIEAVSAREQRELERRESAYRGGRGPLPVRRRVVVLVDDGLATGSTMLAGVRALRRLEPQSIVVAVPVGPADTCDRLAEEADEVVCAYVPERLRSVGEWYEDFTQTTDDEVRTLLEQTDHAAT